MKQIKNKWRRTYRLESQEWGLNCLTQETSFVADMSRWLKCDVSTTPHCAHLTHANISSRVAQGAEQAPSRIVFCLTSKKSSSSSQVMFRARSLLLDLPPLPLPRRAPSLQNPSHSVEPCDPRLGGQSGRLVEQSPLTWSGGERKSHRANEQHRKLQIESKSEITKTKNEWTEIKIKRRRN